MRWWSQDIWTVDDPQKELSYEKSMEIYFNSICLVGGPRSGIHDGVYRRFCEYL